MTTKIKNEIEALSTVRIENLPCGTWFIDTENGKLFQVIVNDFDNDYLNYIRCLEPESGYISWFFHCKYVKPVEVEILIDIKENIPSKCYIEKLLPSTWFILDGELFQMLGHEINEHNNSYIRCYCIEPEFGHIYYFSNLEFVQPVVVEIVIKRICSNIVLYGEK